MSVTVTDLDWYTATAWLVQINVHQADRLVGYDAVASIVAAHRKQLAADLPLEPPDDADLPYEGP